MNKTTKDCDRCDYRDICDYKDKDDRKGKQDQKDKNDHKDKYHEYPTQTHVHEFAGSTQLAGKILHNHRFAGVTSEMIPYEDTHIHAILVNTDFFSNHYHEVGIRTGPPIFIEGEKHVHYVEGETTINFNHDHDFEFTTFIQDLLVPDPPVKKPK